MDVQGKSRQNLQFWGVRSFVHDFCEMFTYIYIYLDYISNLYKYIYIYHYIYQKKQLDIWYMDILCGVWCRIQRGSEQFRFVLRILFEARLGIMMTYLHDSLLCMASMVMS